MGRPKTRFGSERAATWLLVALGLTLVFSAANRDLLTGRAVARWDADTQFAPWHSLVADFARSGRVLLWNPWSDGGSPDFAEPQFGAFSPVTLAVGLVGAGSETAFRFYWLSIWLLGGLGTLVLARHVRSPPWGGFIASLGFLFSGFMTGHAEHTPFLVAFVALPWMLWRIDVALKDQRLLPAVEAGAIWGVSALSGYPGMVMVSGGYVILWVMGRSLTRARSPAAVEEAAPVRPRSGKEPLWWTRTRLSLRGPRPQVLLPLTVLSTWLVVGLIVCSPVYTGFLMEGRGFTDRAGPLPRAIAVGSNALHPRALGTLASPVLSFVKWSREAWPYEYTDVSSTNVYTGVVVGWLALFALMNRVRSKWRWWVAGAGLFGLGMALAEVLPLRGWLYDVFPPARYFRHAAIFRSYFIFSGVLLAMYGARSVGQLSVRIPTSEPRLRPWDSGRLLSWIGIGLSLFAGAAYVFVVRSLRLNVNNEFHLVAVAPWGLALLGATLALKLRRRRAAVIMVLVSLAIVDALWTSSLSYATTATRDPQELSHWEWVDENRSTELRLSHMVRLKRPPLEAGHTNKHLTAKLPVLAAYTASTNRFHRSWIREERLAEAATVSDRIFFGAKGATPEVRPTDRTFAAYLRRAQIVDAMPLVVHDRDAMLRIGAGGEPAVPPDSGPTEVDEAPPAEPISFDLITYDPDRLELLVEVPETGYVLITDRWAPGWRAKVDGAAVPVLGGNFIFRAIPVTEGRRTIKLTYRPFGHPFLLWISWLTVGLTMAMSTIRRLRVSGN